MKLRGKLSHLNFQEARKLLGPSGDRLIRQGGRFEIDIAAQVELDTNRFRLRLNGSEVTIELDSGRNRRLRFYCSSCDHTCPHVGAAFFSHPGGEAGPRPGPSAAGQSSAGDPQ